MWKITSPNKIDKIAAVAYIDTEKKPVIFWDTCSLLDIVRLPLPDRNQTIDTLEKLIEIKDKIVAKEIISISSELCVTEFNNHIENWVKNLEIETKKLSNRFNNFIEYSNKANVVISPIVKIDLSLYNLEKYLCQITHSIINETIFITEDRDFADFAHFRVTNKVPPARKKGEYKDCYIWGTCLEIRKKAIDKSYSYNFMSSNVEDYAQKDKKTLQDEIKHETTLYGINYFQNFKVAYGTLKLSGIF